MVTRRRLSPSEGSRRRAARPGISQRLRCAGTSGCDETIHARRHGTLPPRSKAYGRGQKTAGRWQRDVTAAAFGGSAGQMTDR
jgi:hypothetical protein